MSVYVYNPSERYRRRAAKRMTSRIVVIIFLFAVFGLGYWLGGLSAQKSIIMLEQEKAVIDEQYQVAQNDMTRLRAEAQTANMRMQQLRTSYEEILPEGPMQELVTMLREQIDQGIDVERLKSIILSARPPQNCSTPESRRFVISTPVYKGPESKVSVESGVVIVSAKGQNVINNQNQPEAWFDPGKPVEVKFLTSDGQSKVKTGVLPIYHSVVVGAKEYRFTVVQGEKSFAKATFDHCDYP